MTLLDRQGDPQPNRQFGERLSGMTSPPFGETPAIELHGVGKRYGAAAALQGCSLTVTRGEFVSLLGPSGCGKTTLLRIIGGFIRQDEGSVRVLGESMDGLPPNKRPVNTVFQSYALFPNRTVAENVMFPLEIAGVSRSERRERAAEMLALVRLEGFGERPVTKLSGGQAQRVALARALVARPDVLLLDEPLAALDLKLRKDMQTELRRIHDELGTTFVYVTHDQAEALAMSDRIVLMQGGRIVQVGPPQAIYDRPSSVFASDFVGEANLLTGTVMSRHDETVTVRIADGLELKGTPMGPMSPGQRVVVSIRPERIGLASGRPPAQPGAVTATVVRTVFLGHIVRCVAQLDAGPLLMVEMPRDQAAPLSATERVVLSWASHHALVLPDHDGESG